MLPHPQATMCGLGLMILTLLIEMTLFLIGASRVDAQVHRRDEVAKKGMTDRTKFTTHLASDLQRGRTAKPKGEGRHKED